MINTDTAQTILDQPKKSLIEIYFELQELYEEKYGKNTVVVIEVGSFYEVYGVDNDEVTVGKPKEIAEVLNLQLTRRNKQIPENSVKNPLLCGFPVATFDRYIARLVQENKYTIVVVKQKGDPPNIVRYVERILSPGVNFDYRFDHDENIVASLLIDQAQGVYTAGYAGVDVSTGHSYIFHGAGSKEDPTAALDQLFALLNSHRTAEVVITLANKQINTQEVLQYLELVDDANVQWQTKRANIAYQNELFTSAFQIESFLSGVEFLHLEKYPLCSESLAILLDFIVDHDYSITKKLNLPTRIESSRYLYLGNNPLEQLNITSRDPEELTILDLVDFTRTSIGRRLLRDRLLHPIVDKHAIEERYDLSDAIAPVADDIDRQLTEVYDLERILRRIKLGRLHPFELNFLYDSLQAARKCIAILPKDGSILSSIMQKGSELDDVLRHMEETFSLEQSSRMANGTICGSFFQTGISVPLDELITQEAAAQAKLITIQEKIGELLEEASGKSELHYIQIKQLDKDGHYISMTKSRYSLIKDSLPTTFVSVAGTVYSLGDFRYKVQTSNVKITAAVIDDISAEIVLLQGKIRARVREQFHTELDILEQKFASIMSETIGWLAALDVALSNVKASKKLRLVRPDIVETGPHENVLSIEALRHPLVEAREENGIYVPNNVVLGNKSYSSINSVMSEMSTDTVRGVLLYGINSSGKSSLMKAMGVAVILAQAGFYVPASSMTFSICKELFTRIVARDNFERGLSSFAVEMMELKNIFNRCSPKSIILGDEISHGTETLSAVSIVVATMLRLSESGALFVFTTHLHQLQQLRYMKDLPHVQSVHLSVQYDEEQDTLIFNRELQPGNGSSIYGLEFAQSLHIDPGFLQNAMTIRKELAGELDELQLLSKKQTSKYNKDLYLSRCSICSAMVDETHHIAPQQSADEDGNIEHFHKNHKANLVQLCESCHDKVHDGSLVIEGYKMTSKGLRLGYKKKG